jgi:hypothetical protein
VTLSSYLTAGKSGLVADHIICVRRRRTGYERVLPSVGIQVNATLVAVGPLNKFYSCCRMLLP